MDQEYLKKEMERIHQRKLIKTTEVAHKVLEAISSDIKSGSIIVMEDSNE